ncbi:MAG TPA: heterodisulfide reductase-related iron-sulfur binding cluster [Candidatus Baltobacteraceae bacterium]|nr:heterodisulfide reductase-related iron-sulfur binding cluster [Candidatus Baltobacteraceae bacterium]
MANAGIAGADKLPAQASSNGHGLGLNYLEDCVHCGLCLASCPTYLTTGVEMSSPRGRIAMVRAFGDGRGAFGSELVRHLDQCLGCLACQAACPSGVVYGRMLETARETIEQRYPRPAMDRWTRRLLVNLFPYPGRLRWLLHGLYWYQRLGIAQVVRAAKLLAIVPRLARMEAALPPVPAPSSWNGLPERTPAVGVRRGTVGLLVGCAQRFFLPDLNRATVSVLAAAGYEVFVPAEQPCCGALHLHSGDLNEARRLARGVMAAFERGNVDLVVANAAGCGAAMKEYRDLFHDTPEWEGRAEAFSARVRDVSEVLAHVSWKGTLKPVPVSVAYHDACHLAHAQRIRVEPRTVLRQIPGLRLIEMEESDVCCGSAGIYNLLQPGMAEPLLERKIARIREADADFVAAGNIGCLLQIRKGLKDAGCRTQAIHPVELLDWSLGGNARRQPR